MTEDERDALYMTAPESKTVAGFIEGLTILAKNMPKGVEQGYAFRAEHDEIHIWGDVFDKAIGTEDEKRLLALGFHWNEELEQWGYYT